MSILKRILAKWKLLSHEKKSKKSKEIILRKLFSWLDVILLIIGMSFISIGIFILSVAAGLITIGICLIALAFFIAAKQAKGG